MNAAQPNRQTEELPESNGELSLFSVGATDAPTGFATDPVHQDKGVWWFWYEDWATRSGPYVDRAGAEFALYDYCKNVLG